MATSSGAEPRKTSGLIDLEKELVCSICTEVLYQPLTLLDCLHTFCGSCLKEWFSWQADQYKKKSSAVPGGNPYTCPSCRASVRDTRPNATVTTLLDMFLKANPSRDRTDAEKEEIKKQYTVGDIVVPKIEGPRRRSRENRRTGRQTDEDEEDRRILEEVRERSRTETGGAGRAERRHAHTFLDPGNTSGSERSRSREQREREVRHRRTREEERRRRHAANATEVGRTTAAASVPTSQAVREADHQQRERQIEHQSSLRSLMSASDGEGAMEEEILRQIIEERILEGINFEELDNTQEEELSERIAAAYRQRHPSRRLPRPANNASTSETATRHRRSRSAQSAHQLESQSTTVINESRPPVSRPRLLEASESDGFRQGHRRGASDDGRRQTSPNPRTARTNSEEVIRHQAARSATDLSGPQNSEIQRTRPRHMSETRRAATGPDQPRISDIWRNAGVRTGLENSTRGVSTQGAVESPQHLSPTNEQPPTMSSTLRNEPNPFPAVDTETVPSSDFRNDLSAMAPEVQQRATTSTDGEASFREPSISCDRCSKKSIQYDLHKHCPRCSMNLCLQCYRQKRGCRHWFGFGYTAKINFNTSMPPGSLETLEAPHVLIGRKYLRSPSGATVRSETDPASNTAAVYTSSDPTERLQEGKFCDRCHEFANPCHWECAFCNEGEWGFCNECVNTQHCCTHPLLPIAHKDLAPGMKQDKALRRSSIPIHASILPIPLDSKSRPSTADGQGHAELEGSYPNFSDLGIGPEYVPLTFTTHCDICSYPIPPSSTRFHCPFHMPSSPDSVKGQGDYDICTSCYTSLTKTGAISAANGINGWRRCPKGHRMVITGFEERGEGQRRVVVKDLVGGWALKDEYYETSAQPFGVESGTWSWRDSPEGKAATRTSRSKSNTTPNPTNFPPSGGVGLFCQATWSYLPDREADPSSKDELLFPRGAEIREAEDINGDWFWGVYMGDKGVFPGGYVRVTGATGLQS